MNGQGKVRMINGMKFQPLNWLRVRKEAAVLA